MFALILLVLPVFAAQHCSQSELQAPEGSRLVHYGSKAQMVCKAGHSPEIREQSAVHCDQGQWTGTLSKCVPDSCRKTNLDVHRLQDGSFEFSPDSESDRMPHESTANAICDADYYMTKTNETDSYQYTTNEVQMYKCHYGMWVGKLKNKCSSIPAKHDIYQAQRFDSVVSDVWYREYTVYMKIAAKYRKPGLVWSVIASDLTKSICPEKITLHQLYHKGIRAHKLVTDDETKNIMLTNGWIVDVPIYGSCVSVAGQCGLWAELHEFYKGTGGTKTAFLYKRNIKTVKGWTHRKLICYIH